MTHKTDSLNKIIANLETSLTGTAHVTAEGRAHIEKAIADLKSLLPAPKVSREKVYGVPVKPGQNI